MYSFNDLKKFSKKENLLVKASKIKVAILADSSTQFLHVSLRGVGIISNIDYQIWEADYNQIERQVLDPSSELYRFQPAFTIILRSPEHLLNQFYKTPLNERDFFWKKEGKLLESIFQQAGALANSKIITNTYFELNDFVLGNYSNKVSSSFIYQLRKLNLWLMETAQKNKNLFIVDLAAITGNKGYKNTIDARLYIDADMVYGFDIIPEIAQNIHAIIQSLLGQFKKCLILDLDNTVWGGIIGDDGLEGIAVGHLGIGKAFSELQLWAKELKHRGIILAICSKNTESIAKEPFEKHPEMELRLDDIAIFVANWENKVDNINYIQSVLQIGFDSMAFLDDNPFERGMVKNAIPALTIPDMPEDPAEYVSYLRSLNLFETASYTDEDAHRTKQYQEEAHRTIFQKSFANEDEFLQSLAMQSEVSIFTPFAIPRVAQLTQRSNQFNLRTQRYSDEDIKKITTSSDYFTLSFTLQDKFGDHGLIGVVILKKKDEETLFIDTWIMSCRVLKRGVEEFILNAIMETAKTKGFKKLMGEYIPTAKNGIVKKLYSHLGFLENGGVHLLEVDNYVPRLSFIKNK